MQISVSAQQISNIQTLGIENGLSNNSVRFIFQDHNGYMWFGTHDGLNRYDGYGFEVFRNSIDDSTSIPHNFVYTIAEDNAGKLYIGTGQGVSLYDPLYRNFSPVYLKAHRTGIIEKIQNSVNIIKSDQQGTIYIGANGMGFLVKPAAKKEFLQIPFQLGAKESVSYSLSSIAVGNDGRVFVFVSDVGLFYYSPKNRKLISLSEEKNSADAMAIDHDNNIWIGTESGIYKYDTGKATWSRGTQNSSLLTSQVSSLFLDKNNRMWVGLPGKGLVVLSLKDDKSTVLKSGNTEPNLTSESISTVFGDNEGRIWIGSLNGGLNIVQPHHSKFNIISNNPFNINSLTSNFVSTFYEDNEKNLWIGTESNGLSVWNRKLNSFDNYQSQPGNNSLSNNWVTSIKRDYLGNIWVATFGGGINKFDPKTKKFKHYICYNPALSLNNRNVLQIFEDSKKDLWATTYASGRLYKYNREDDKFEVFDQNLDDIYFLTENKNGDFLAGNASRLIKIDRTFKKHQFYDIGKPVRAIYRDANGQLWLGTEGGGLLLFDLSAGKIIKRFSTDDGLSNNSILSIQEDNHHNLWMSTFNGLIKFNTRSKKITNYYQEDGLQSNQFFYRSAAKLSSGEMVFGGVKGFNIFYPDSIKANSTIKPIFITSIKVKGKLLTGESEFVNKIANGSVTSLKLPYDDAVISVDFATLEYSSPGSIQYAYYLEGWDKGWNYSGKLRVANYTNIHEGNYILHVKSTNAAGVWSNNEKVIKIEVLPPWWRTWVAYLIYLFILFFLIRKFVIYQRDKERLKFQVQLAATKMVQEKELHDRKLSFFTHISHEFRTPLTLIINPIKEFLNSKSHQVETKELIVVYRNARRLLSLVDQLLHFQKANPDKLKVSSFDLVNFCKEVFLCFVQQAKFNEITFEFTSSKENIEVLADREKLEIAIFNLISNALKYTPAGGSIYVWVSEEDENAKISVKDTGVGISEELGEEIFNRFYQVTDKENYKGGFGIGLYVVKEIMESHQGNVSFDSIKNEGATFQLKFPKKVAFDGRVVEYATTTPMHTEERIEIEDTNEIKPTAVPKIAPDINIISERSTILLVDDNLEIRNYIKSIFEADYQIMEAESAEKAFVMIENEIPNLVITDVVMGEMSGVDLCQRIKEDSALMHIPVILLTSATTAALKLKGIEGGADDFITKPFDKEILVARVANLLRSRINLHQHFYNQITLKVDDYSVSPDLKKFLENCIEITEKHLDDKDFNVKQLADELDMSHSALYKKVKLISGKSINEFIRFIRLRKVAQLFINTDCKVNEGAYSAGFNDIRYFREQFAKVFGMNPSEYIRTYRNVGNKNYKIGEKFRKQ
ncbi:MAG: two-component regulator propeller domain-containing protein [Pelobium sp.]